MPTFDVPFARWRLGGDGRGPRALDAVTTMLNSKEADMPEPTTIEDLKKIAQRLRQSLNREDRRVLGDMLLSEDDATDQPPDKLAQLPESEIKHALDRMSPAARAHWRERQERRHASNLEDGLKRWPQAKRLGL